MRAFFVVAALAAGGCANVVRVPNGGVPVVMGSCADVTLGANLEPIQAGAPDCASRSGFVVPERAAAAFWQVTSDAWAGPAMAPRAWVEIEVPKALASGESGGVRSLSSGDRESGSHVKSLESGAREEGLASGEGEKGLASGEREKALASGGGEKGLASGERDSGAGAARDVGEGTRERAVLSVRKTGKGRASDEGGASFVLAVSNDSDVQVRRVLVVDRVGHELTPEAQGATISALPDGSSLVVFKSEGPLAPRETRSYRIAVFAKTR